MARLARDVELLCVGHARAAEFLDDQTHVEGRIMRRNPRGSMLCGASQCKEDETFNAQRPAFNVQLSIL